MSLKLTQSLRQSRSLKIAVFATSRSDFEVARLIVDCIDGFVRGSVYFYVNPSLLDLFEETGANSLGSQFIEGSTEEFESLIQAVRSRFLEDGFEVGILIGDRWETLLLAQTLVSLGVKIVHHSGGDVTSGSLDNAYRYSCSMLASLHWVSAELHGRRLVNLGIPPDQIYFVGEPQLGRKKEVSHRQQPKVCDLDFDLEQPFVLVCIHPSIDLQKDQSVALREVESFLNVQPFNVLFTAPNHDPKGMEIKKFWGRLVTKHPNWHMVDSLGGLFASVLVKSVCLIGNSSAGLFEAPVLGVPVINIGARQNGRLRAPNVYDCSFDADEIHQVFERAVAVCRNVQYESPYFNPNWHEEVRVSLEKLGVPESDFQIGIKF